MAEAFLKLGVAAETELGDEPGHRRRADARALGEPCHRLEPGDRIGGEQDPCEAAFGRRERAEAAAHDLADARALGRGVRDVCYIVPQPWRSWNVSLTTREAAVSFPNQAGRGRL